MASRRCRSSKATQPISFLLLFITISIFISQLHCISVDEATIGDIQDAFRAGTLNSRQLVLHYLRRIHDLNPLLHAVIELNPDALLLAEHADRERRAAGGYVGGLHGIPVLLKDNIATLDKLNTTAGSFALLGSKVPRDAGVVQRLRRAGAIILGKSNLSEWANFRSTNSSDGWSARGGQTKNPYFLHATPCGSSSGSAVGVAANLATVSLGTETDGSILCPASFNSVVGIKPTVGLTSRAGVVPISHNQDTVGPLCRTVADAVEVLDVIVGYDKLDIATAKAASYIPEGGYKQFLRVDGLLGKRLGLLQYPLHFPQTQVQAINDLVVIMRKLGAVVVENLILWNVDENLASEVELRVLEYDFKQDLNNYIAHLKFSPVRNLLDVIEFNKKDEREELSVFDQDIFYQSQNTTGFKSKTYIDALKWDRGLTKHGIRRLLRVYKLDAVVAPFHGGISSAAAIAGYPGISVPAGYTNHGVPFGIIFVGEKGSEPSLISIAFSLECATLIRKQPTFRS